MDKEFSTSWRTSVQPRKQRKFRYNAPTNIRRVMLSAHLDKTLSEKYQKRSFPLRKGDTVKIVRGDFKKKEGIIERVDLKKLKIFVSGCDVTRVSGQKSKVAIDPSNVVIISLKLDDKKRKDAVSRQASAAVKKEN
ncbi:MAG: 50S ribosomal protein L24 [Candidatus Woesearchaeota archaeon]